jgi:hypothetical protein
MSRRPCAFRQRDIARAVRGAEAAGVEIGRLDIDLARQDFDCAGCKAAGRKRS